MKKAMILAAMAMPFALAAQSYFALSIPDSLRAGANEVVREESMQFIAKSDREGSIVYRKVTTLLNKESDAGRIAVFYDANTKVKRFEARLLDAQGQEIRKVAKGEIKDLAAVDGFSIYVDDRYKLLEVTHSRYPYTIEYEYELTAKGMYFITFPRWNIQKYHQSVENARLVVSLPADIPLHYRAMNIDLEPKVESVAGASVYTWEVSGLKAMAKEPFSPSEYEVLPRLLTAPGRFRIDDYEGSMSSWEAYGEFMNRLFEDRDALPPDLAAEVRALTAGAASNTEKIERLYRYMQRNMRYVSVQLGIGGWQPFDAAYVARNKYGDCKALSNFMKAMLKEAGIDSYPVLIYNGSLPYDVQEDFTRPAFNHCILHVPEEDAWLECTSSDYPPGYIGAGNSGRNVLLITGEGGRLARTPELDAENNVADSRTEITVNPDGSATARSVIHAHGEAHENYRSAAAYFSKEDLDKWFLRRSSLPSLKLDRLQVKPSADKPEAHVEFEGSLPRYASRTGKRLFVPLNLVNPYDVSLKKMENRRHPVVMNKGFTHADTIILHLPEDIQVEGLKDGTLSFKEEFGSYRADIDVEPGKITFTRRLQIRPFRLPPDRYEQFRTFLAEVGKADKTMAVLVEKKT